MSSSASNLSATRLPVDSHLVNDKICSRMTGTRGYHHGDLPRALLDAAVEVIAESGPAALSLRDLARRAGVSHAAPAHHFGDKAGLLTALAVQGFDLLADALRGAEDLLSAGVAYVDFAVGHRAHFDVMFRPDLYRSDGPEVRAARERPARRCAPGWPVSPTATAGPPTPGGTPSPPGRSCTASRRCGSPARCRRGWETTPGRRPGSSSAASSSSPRPITGRTCGPGHQLVGSGIPSV